MATSQLPGGKSAVEILALLATEMVSTNRCSFEEAFHAVRFEIQREYDRRIMSRRDSFKVVGSLPSTEV
jgi:hypothetical protein